MCIFCEKPQTVIVENDYFYAMYDGFPVSEGHGLIISKRHVETYFDLEKKEHDALYAMIHYIKKHLDERFHPDGYNIGNNNGKYAGQSIMHFHLHIIPRYKGDVLHPKGGVRGVIPSKRSY